MISTKHLHFCECFGTRRLYALSKCQKNHLLLTCLASAPGSKRAHDLVDLQLIAANADLDLRRVRDVCVRLFNYRKRQTWPPTIAVGTDWESLYAAQSANVSVLPTVEEAVAWTQRLVERIDAAR